MEGMLPGYIWKQFGYLFPNTEFEIHLIGPDDKSCKSSLLSAIQMEGH